MILLVTRFFFTFTVGIDCKVCLVEQEKKRAYYKIRHKKYYAEHKESILKKNREYSLTHKVEERERKAKYRLRNREKINASQLKYRSENIEKFRKRSNSYYKNNKEKVLAKNRKHYQEHREHAQSRHAKYYQANKDKAKARNALNYKKRQEHYKENHNSHYRNNVDMYKARSHRRRARVFWNGGKWKPWQWKKIKMFYSPDGTCLRCGKINGALTVDHVTPLFIGGLNSSGNLQPLCLHCNLSRSKIKTEDFRKDNGLFAKSLEPYLYNDPNLENSRTQHIDL